MKVPAFLFSQVQAWRTTFRAISGSRVALFVEDRHVFASALLAAWAEKKQVVLPGDVLVGTLGVLRDHVDAWVGEFPGMPVLKPGEPTQLPWEELDSDFEGLVIFTSGSTGQPTSIVKKLKQLIDEVATLEATFGSRISPQASFFSTVSHQHIYGLLCAVLWPLSAGRGLTPRRLEYPEELQQVLTKPSVLISSPAHLKRLPDGVPWQTQLHAVFSSGGPLPEEGAAKARVLLGQQPIELFGSSETGGIAWREGTSASWQPLRGIELQRSSEGTLEIRSPHLADARWFTTSDLVEMVGNTFTLLGRTDRLAKIEEKRVSLELIENAVKVTGLLVDVRVVVLAGARVCLGLAGVPSAAGRQLSKKTLSDRLKAALEEKVERVALPRRFRFVDALPMNAQGKVTQSLLQGLFAPERPDGVWQERSDNHAVLEMNIGTDLRVFDGHFPQTPIVPGIAQVDWAMSWGREAFSIKGHLLRIEVLKFQRLMRPGHRVRLALSWNAEKSTLTFKYTGAKAVYSSGKMVLPS